MAQLQCPPRCRADPALRLYLAERADKRGSLSRQALPATGSSTARSTSTWSRPASRKNSVRSSSTALRQLRVRRPIALTTLDLAAERGRPALASSGSWSTVLLFANWLTTQSCRCCFAVLDSKRLVLDSGRYSG